MEDNLTEQLAAGGQTFSFSLCRKAEELGPVSVEHWWMRVTDLYGQRGRKTSSATNHQAVTDCFWAMCREESTTDDPEVQESYLLSKLVPHARSQGSRRIFYDAHLWSGSSAARKQKGESTQLLQELLEGGRDQKLSSLEFQRRTRDVLGRPPFEPEAIVAYEEFVGDFLGRARSILAADESRGVQYAIDEWSRVMKSIGRRGGRELQKLVLDVVSYECRAALHRCYSAVWYQLLVELVSKYELSLENYIFLRFWHLDQVSEAAEGDFADFHLFHGHVFALHPASAALLCTAAGRDLTGEWLQNRASAESFGRLLHGIYVAVHHYAQTRDDLALRRRK